MVMPFEEAIENLKEALEVSLESKKDRNIF